MRLSIAIFLVLVLPFVHAQKKKITVRTTPPPVGKFVGSHSNGKLVQVQASPSPGSKHQQLHNSNIDSLTSLVSPSPKPNPNGAFCDVWDQDCPSGYKCVAENLSSQPRCRLLENNPDQVGDPCSNKGNNDGDSCDIDGICVNGICRAVCEGSSVSWNCPDIKDLCHFYAGGTPLCEEKCHPLINGVCGGGDMFCSMDSTSPDQRFTCMNEPSGVLGMSGASCVETSQCQQGFACMLKTSLPSGFCNNSASQRCCTPLAEDEDDCPSGLTLEDFYQAPPPGLQGLGVCVFV